MERALGVSFENCHRKHLAVVWSKMGVHWQNWSWWPSHQTNWTCCGPVLPLVQTCITCFFLDTCHTFIHYHDPKQVKLKFGTKTYTPASILPAFLTFYQLLSLLIFLFSRPPHLILLSILANPIFIFNSKISSYNPNFFLFHRIIEPLTSRCSKFRFKPLSTETLEKRLNMICKEENVNCDNKVWKDDLFWKWLKISSGVSTIQPLKLGHILI